MRAATLTISVIFFFLASCSGDLHSVRNADRPGPQFHVGENASVYFNYRGKEGQMMIFDVKIKNTGDQTLFIDPGKIQYSASFKSKALYTVSPTDPHPLSEYDVGLRLRSRIRSHDTFKLLIGALSAGIQAYSRTSWAEGILPGLAANREIITTSATFAEDFATDALEAKNERLEEDIEYIPNEILQKTMIHPGNTLQGKVFFDAIPRMKYYEFQVPVASETFTFQFRK